MLLVKVILIALLGFIVVSLFTGLFFLVKDKGQTNRTANALSVRIGLSIAAIVVVLIAGFTGVLKINPDPRSGAGGAAGAGAATAPGSPSDSPADSQGVPASREGGGRIREPVGR